MRLLRRLYALTAAVQVRGVAVGILAVVTVLLVATVVRLQPPSATEDVRTLRGLALMRNGQQEIANHLLATIQTTLVQISQQLDRPRPSSGTNAVPRPGAPVVSPVLPVRDEEMCMAYPGTMGWLLCGTPETVWAEVQHALSYPRRCGSASAGC